VREALSGHGSTGADSHVTLPLLAKTLAELERTDLVPFKRAVEAGVDMMMTAHVALAGGRRRASSGELRPKAHTGSSPRKARFEAS